MHVEMVCFAFKLSEVLPYLHPGEGGGGTPVRVLTNETCTCIWIQFSIP